jgi:hypothetical protein
MNVIGIDPAPTKGLHVFDGGDHHISLDNARSALNSYAASDVLVCWDAPLTGPPIPIANGSEASGSSFFQRSIESFFSRAWTGFKTPLGISVRGYAGCPHWAMTRSLIGLPRVGPFDAEASLLPFNLLTTNSPPVYGRCIVEVHPAVAIWLWCRSERDPLANWEYKKSREVLHELWNILLRIESIANLFHDNVNDVPISDDALDARVAYALGYLWCHEPGAVTLLGDGDSGAFLLPCIDGMEDAFNAFASGKR